MNWLDPIEELYNMYLEKEDTLRIVEVIDDGLDFGSDCQKCQLQAGIKPTALYQR